jgi:hypothetical protein
VIARTQARPIRHRAGFAVTLPAGADVLEEQDESLQAALPAPGRPALPALAAEVRPRLSIRVEPDVTAERLEGWVGVSLIEQADQLLGARLVDEEAASVAGRPGRHTITRHLADGLLSVTLEQWWVAAGGRGTVLSVSLPSVDAAEHAGAIVAVAASLVPVTR